MAADLDKVAARFRREGDEAYTQRVAELFRQHRGRLFAWLRRKAPRDEAEEIVARTFINVLEMGRSVYSVSNLPAYVKRIATNQLFNYYRDRATHRAKEVLLIPEKMETYDSLESTILSDECQNALMGVINGLPPRCRTAFQLRVWRGKSCKEITAHFAEMGLTITERTVLRDISFAYEACQRALKAWESSTSKDGNGQGD